jgi:hypothetical protein
LSARKQGCQMVYFQTKNPNLGKFWRSMQWKMVDYFIAIWSIFCHLVYFIAIWYILWTFGIFYVYLVYFFLFWYVVPEKSGNLAVSVDRKRKKKKCWVRAEWPDWSKFGLLGDCSL